MPTHPLACEQCGDFKSEESGRFCPACRKLFGWKRPQSPYGGRINREPAEPSPSDEDAVRELEEARSVTIEEL